MHILKFRLACVRALPNGVVGLHTLKQAGGFTCYFLRVQVIVSVTVLTYNYNFPLYAMCPESNVSRDFACSRAADAPCATLCYVHTAS